MSKPETSDDDRENLIHELQALVNIPGVRSQALKLLVHLGDTNANLEIAKDIETLVKQRGDYDRLLDQFEQLYGKSIDDDETTLIELEQKLEQFDEHSMSDNSLAVLQLQRAESLLHMGKHPQALQLYRQVFCDMAQGSEENHQLQVMMGLSRCLCEMGQYEKAIMIGKPAISLNRYYPGVRHWLIQSCRRQGNVETAKQFLAEAVIYEAPWDDTHRSKMARTWREWFPEEEDQLLLLSSSSEGETCLS